MAKATALARARRVRQRPKPKSRSASIGPDGPKHPGNRQLYDKRGRPDAGAWLLADYPKPKVATFCAALWLTFTLPLTVGFLGFGFYPRSGFMHIDLGPARPVPIGGVAGTGPPHWIRQFSSQYFAEPFQIPQFLARDQLVRNRPFGMFRHKLADVLERPVTRT